MNAAFRHITLRLWTTALAGGLFCTILLPLWQRVLGLEGIWIPMLAVMTGCFALCGLVMNRFGLSAIRRQIAEAAVWERAGMNAEAEAAFERAKALYDGFWLSPIQRRRHTDGIMLRLARFCLAQPNLGNSGRAILLSYLERHPEDATVALEWLERILQQEVHSAREQEAAARINDALPDHDKIQRLLLQFYLGNGRSDFEALQTYRRVWQRTGALPVAIVRKVARLLLNEACVNDWALQVYLKGYASGDAYCLDGLAASLQALRPTTENGDSLRQAEDILAGLDDAQRRRLLARFEPRQPDSDVTAEGKAMIRPVRPDAPGLRHRAALLREGLGRRMVALYHRMRAARRRFHASGRLSRITVWIAVACVFSVMIAAGARMVLRNREPPSIGDAHVQPPQVAINDPFTIQVAAYLSSSDAQSYVKRLKQQNIDAFWTKATSAKRTWYQVKVSHFANKIDARKYGEKLKTQGVIDDFYVANYVR